MPAWTDKYENILWEKMVVWSENMMKLQQSVAFVKWASNFQCFSNPIPSSRLTVRKWQNARQRKAQCAYKKAFAEQKRLAKIITRFLNSGWTIVIHQPENSYFLDKRGACLGWFPKSKPTFWCYNVAIAIPDEMIPSVASAPAASLLSLPSAASAASAHISLRVCNSFSARPRVPVRSGHPTVAAQAVASMRSKSVYDVWICMISWYVCSSYQKKKGENGGKTQCSHPFVTCFSCTGPFGLI